MIWDVDSHAGEHLVMGSDATHTAMLGKDPELRLPVRASETPTNPIPLIRVIRRPALSITFSAVICLTRSLQTPNKIQKISILHQYN